MGRCNPRNTVIGRRIEYLRRDVNKETLEDLARHVDASPSAIRQWQTGRTLPSADNMIRIAEHYLVSLDYLLCREFHDLSYEELINLPDEKIKRKPSTEQKARFKYVAVEQPPFLR
jgi:transcriptional regulator with XRE-family HTH domain